MSSMPKIPRCIVTGNRNGKSTIIKEGPVTNVSEHIPNLVISDVWATNTMPIDLEKSVVIENTLFPETPKNGTYVRYVQIPPDSELEEHHPQTIDSDEPHSLMHKTKTLDYIIILQGELYLILEEGKTLLRPGDIVIQRGTNHAWSNQTNKPCIQLAILLDAKSFADNS